jgi:hypothetical protein
MKHVIAQRIATAYLVAKLAEAQQTANQPGGMCTNELENFHGWFADYTDFTDWATEQGYNTELLPVAWRIVGTLLGLP